MKMNLKSIFYKFDLNLKEDNFNDKKPINQEEIIISPIIGDNCFCSSISLYLINEQSSHKIIREIIYEEAKECKENLKPFF